jgi:glyoxylase-like metal-dependent hydrolase (beta-lactamase superfamily II)
MSHAQREAWAAGTLPEVEQVAPGLWSIPVPLPLSGLRYVIVYALELSSGVAVIDAGWETDEAWSALTAGLAVAGYTPADVRGIAVTHIHPDHYGLAGRLRAASGAWIGLHPADAALIPARYVNVDSVLAENAQLLRKMGCPDTDAGLAEVSMHVRAFVDAARPDVLLQDGDKLDLPGWNVTAVWTPGHSPGHLCFADADRGYLFSGDHVLPKVTSNVSIHPQQRVDPLGDYRASLAKVAGLGIEDVLPAHEYRFRGLTERVLALHAHHDVRLREIDEALAAHPGSTCWELATRLSWSRPWAEIQGYLRRAATGETLAHLVELEQRGLAVRSGGCPEHWWRPAELLD